MKSICIYHSRDLDGWMSAAIVKKWWDKNVAEKYPSSHNSPYHNDNIKNIPPEIDMLGWDYGNEIPDLSGYDKVIMCDISFPKEDMDKIHNKNLTWIDHHISAINSLQYTNNRDSSYCAGIRDVKFAACELTWKYFFPKGTMPEIVRLLGRYDCFGHKGTEEEQDVLEFQYGARQRIDSYIGAYNALVLPVSSNLIGHILNDSKAIYAYLKTEAKQTYAKAFPITLKEPSMMPTEVMHSSTSTLRRFLCVNQERFNPVNFGIDYHADGYDGVACFWYQNGMWHFSLYNDNELVDCSVIAKSFGGGGHKGAAGFIVDDLSRVIKTDSK